ncbi:MAG: flagella synthesis protein FlgN [Candidatus Methylumidiphilus sp.]
MSASDAGPLARIEEEIAAVKTLLRLVETEQLALLRPVDADELHGLTAQKMEAVGRIGDLTRLRHAALSQGGYRADETGMRDWVADAPDRSAHERWEFLLSMSGKVKALNQMNGRLIAKLMHQNQTILGVFGMAAKGMGLYGADGRPQGFGAGRLK